MRVLHCATEQQGDVKQPPYPAHTEGAEFKRSEQRMAEVQPVRTQQTEADGENKRCRPVLLALLSLLTQRRIPLISFRLSQRLHNLRCRRLSRGRGYCERRQCAQETPHLFGCPIGVTDRDFRTTFDCIRCHHQVVKAAHLLDNQEIHDDARNETHGKSKDCYQQHEPWNRGHSIERRGTPGLAGSPEFLRGKKLHCPDDHFLASQRSATV